MGEEALLELEEVTFRHRNRRMRDMWRTKRGAGIFSISLKINSGTVLGLIGPNGAGKTTLLNLMIGLNPEDSGVVRLLGKSRRHMDRAKAQSKIGLMPERVSWSGTSTPRSTLVRFQTMRGENGDVSDLLALVGLSSRADTPLDDLSQGMRQRLSLACALMGSPDILLLDEPLNGLDPVAQAAFRSLLRQLAAQGKAIVVSSHNLHEMAQFVDSVAILHRGQLVASGSLSEVERALATAPKTEVQVSGGEPDASLLPKGATVESVQDNLWIIRLDGDSDSSNQVPSLVESLVGAGHSIHQVNTVRPNLEDLLTAATGESVDTVGLEVASDAMVPVRTWEVGEDE